MASVCFACGLTTDANGNLIVNTGGHTWPFTCTEASGGAPLYCDPTSGELVGAPPKYVRSGFVVASYGTGELTHFAPVSPSFTTLSGFARLTIVNPSSCYPMQADVRFGVNHGDFENNKQPFTDFGTNESRVELVPIYSATGTTADISSDPGGHQIWGGAAFESLDSQGASSLRSHVIPPGGTAFFDVGATIRVDVYNGDTQLQNYQTFIYVLAYNA